MTKGISPRGKAHESEDFTMTNIYALRNHFELREYQTAITRADFEAHFKATKEKMTFTFGGWDGESYDGESRTARVYRTDIKGYEDAGSSKSARGFIISRKTARCLKKQPGQPIQAPDGWSMS